MKNFRLAAVLAATGLLIPLLATAPAAAATTKFHAWITCDPATNAIRTGITGVGGVAANWPVTVDFKVESGYSATATTSARIPAFGTTTTVAGKSDANGDLTVAGYQRSFPISSNLFYTEKVVATVKNLSGDVLAERSASCAYDTRTTVTLTCDRDAKTVTARAEGVQYNEPQQQAMELKYEYGSVAKSSTGEPVFGTARYLRTTHYQSAVNGSFSDLGWTDTVPELQPGISLERTVWVTVRSPHTGRTLGFGTATCVWAS
ncbi:hypothetical protein GCM10029976_006400 [Kribbella albertanoniae]|uniref:Uncharacterized protein n=1 Tax=Kribbella albertanoniae TaxID=1266829 RepID=A0A4R4Q884_9ACTN|nr:hypothetical protein [Kribbella albertanoniae]TDC31438.1 hypothetical protein E1261_10955 [Kribbella albertanoniae]